MKAKEMDRFTAHCDKYFRQSGSTVLHPVVSLPLHIDVLRYPPNEQYPFWKLVTMGASDYKMPEKKPVLGNRNEYMMFVHKNEDLSDMRNVMPYVTYLTNLALYPYMKKTFVTYGHSVEWGDVEEGEEMVCAFLCMPQAIEDAGVLRCRFSPLKTAICLQAILLNRAETDRLLEIGPERFDLWLYPEDDTRRHFLSELKRTIRF